MKKRDHDALPFAKAISFSVAARILWKTSTIRPGPRHIQERWINYRAMAEALKTENFWFSPANAALG